MKKQPKFINVGESPILIVGEKMGKQRPGQDRYSLEGNGTGDFVHEAIEGKENIILTNIVNYYYPGNFNRNMYVAEGLQDLKELVRQYNPRKIITLGVIAKEYVDFLKDHHVFVPDSVQIINLAHPSWVNRFKRKDRHLYIKILRNELD